MAYLDSFVIAVPKGKIDAYKELSRLTARIWIEHGALSYTESLGDDVPYGEVTSFPRAVQASADEVVVLGIVTYPSREAREEVLAKVRTDQRLAEAYADPPFDGKRLIFGGFTTFHKA